MDDPPGGSSSLVCAAKAGVIVVSTTFCGLVIVPTDGGGEGEIKALGVLCVTLALTSRVLFGTIVEVAVSIENLYVSSILVTAPGILYVISSRNFKTCGFSGLRS